MTAPVSQRVRCIVTGHDWRRAIAPREGYYLRCRRCWTNRPVDEAVETVEPAWRTPAGDRATA
jgi:hypothetical protein